MGRVPVACAEPSRSERLSGHSACRSFRPVLRSSAKCTAQQAASPSRRCGHFTSRPLDQPTPCSSGGRPTTIQEFICSRWTRLSTEMAARPRSAIARVRACGRSTVRGRGAWAAPRPSFPGVPPAGVSRFQARPRAGPLRPASRRLRPACRDAAPCSPCRPACREASSWAGNGLKLWMILNPSASYDRERGLVSRESSITAAASPVEAPSQPSRDDSGASPPRRAFTGMERRWSAAYPSNSSPSLADARSRYSTARVVSRGPRSRTSSVTAQPASAAGPASPRRA